jgi:ERCC4-related helicase
VCGVRKTVNSREIFFFHVEFLQGVMSRFRSGEINCLVSTSVGEEGLDVGEVDLIINYDSATSAVRSVQRSGRTGRKRKGRLFSGMWRPERSLTQKIVFSDWRDINTDNRKHTNTHQQIVRGSDTLERSR